MNQSKGTALYSIKPLYFSLFVSYIAATKGRLNIYQWTGTAAALLCLFHLISSWLKEWLKGGRSIMRRPKILGGKKNQFSHPNGQCQNQKLSGWYFCQILFMCIKVKAASLSVCSRHVVNLCIFFKLFEDGKASYFLIRWYSLRSTVMRIFIIMWQNSKVILLVQTIKKYLEHSDLYLHISLIQPNTCLDFLNKE